MKKSPHTILKQKIARYFESHRFATVKKSKLINELKIKNDAMHYLNDVMAELIRENKIQQVKTKTYQFVNKAGGKTGRIMITKSGPGFVTVEGMDEEVFIKKKDLANALHGDLVAVKILETTRRGPEGFVVDVVERKKIRFVGRLELHPKYAFVIPDDPKIHVDFFIPQRHINKAQEGQKVVVELLTFEAESRRPEARVIEIIGFPSEAGVDIQSVFKAHDISEAFTDDILEQAEIFSEKISEEEIASRKDIRNLQVFTIDPVDAKDFDDAISLTTLPNGNYELGVHIADVSHFVQENTALDKEALQRGCSVYLVDRVIPMLPERLANDLCSLKPNVDRLTYSIFMELDAKTSEQSNYSIQKTVINSKRRYTYEEAQAILDKTVSDENSETLLKMHEISKQIRHDRFEFGSINFHTPEVRFALDENGKPTGIIRKQQLESMKLIEEFMLSANKVAAEHIIALSEKMNTEVPSIYRVHEKPSPQKIDFLKAFLSGMGYNISFPDRLTPKTFQNLIGPLLEGDDADIINDIAVRSMMKAHYTTKTDGHFGLGFLHYSHFTSPIRRYPDLILHRVLFEYELGADAKRRRHFKKALTHASELSSENEKNAVTAERESIKLKQVEFISDHLNEQFTGKISGVTDFGLFIEIEEFLIEGLVSLRRMKDDHYNVDGKTMTLIGSRTGKTFRLGQRVTIEVVEVNKITQQIDFELV